VSASCGFAKIQECLGILAARCAVEVYNIFATIYKTYKEKALLKKRIYRDSFIKNLYWTNEEHRCMIIQDFM